MKNDNLQRLPRGHPPWTRSDSFQHRRQAHRLLHERGHLRELLDYTMQHPSKSCDECIERPAIEGKRFCSICQPLSKRCKPREPRVTQPDVVGGNKFQRFNVRVFCRRCDMPMGTLHGTMFVNDFDVDDVNVGFIKATCTPCRIRYDGCIDRHCFIHSGVNRRVDIEDSN